MVGSDEPLWSAPVTVEDIPETGLHAEIEAPARARERLAEIAGLRELSQLAATFDLTKTGSRVHVVGQLRALVGQTCVVTLEPIEDRVVEPIDLTFAPVSAVEPDNAGETSAKEPPEPIVNGVIDLGAVASEFLMLGIDPYPRKDGAQFVPPKADRDGTHPFAALEALKKRQGDAEP